MVRETTSAIATQHIELIPNARIVSRGLWWRRGIFAIGLITAAVSAVAIIQASSPSRLSSSVVTHTIERGELLVAVTEQGTLESSNNTEIKCKVRGENTIISVVESGTQVTEGDELVRLETLLIDEEISERTKFWHLAQSDVARSKADVARAELAINEYLEGRFVTSMATLQKDLAIAESRLLSAKDMLGHAKMMSKSGYVGELDVEEKNFVVEQSALAVKVTETEIDVLERFTKREMLAMLNGNLKAAKATHEANLERASADNKRLKRARDELGHCVVTAARSGLVIYPTGQEWKNAPDIEEGATVHKDQVLLLMPDLSRMQVKVGIHESIIDRIMPGIDAKVTAPGKTFSGEISYVASVAKPAGWWTGNVVKYDTIVNLPQGVELKPGMSVKVEVILARYDDVLMIPTSAVVESTKGHSCWIKNGDNTDRRTLQLGDSSDMFIVVESGLSEGDQVVLDPVAHIEEAQIEAAMTLKEPESSKTQLTDF